MDTKNQEEQDFLKHLGSTKNPFKTPDGYFDNLSSKVMDNCVETALTNTESGFKVPKNYFESFVVKQQKNKIVYLLPYVATIAAVIVFGFFVFKQQDNNTLNNEEIISYLALDEGLTLNEIVENYNDSNASITSNLDSFDEINIDLLSTEFTENDLIEF